MKKLLVTAAILLAGTAIASAQTFESPSIRFQSEQNDEQSIGKVYQEDNWQNSHGQTQRHLTRESYGSYGYSPDGRTMDHNDQR